MAGRFGDFLGTVFTRFRLGLQGPWLKANAGAVEARNPDDDGYAAIRAALAQIYGDDIELNAGAAGAGGDRKFTLRRPAAGMTHDLVVVFPATDPAPGQALTVAALVGDVITLQWTTIAAGDDKAVFETTTLAFGSSSPVDLFTKPAGAIVERVQIIIDESFDGAPQVSVGIAGQTSRYAAATQVDLTAEAGTVFELTPGLPASGQEALIATYAAGGATEGSARILITYGTPG